MSRKRTSISPATFEVSDHSDGSTTATELPFREEDLQGFRLFELLGPLLKQLHDVGTERDRSGNRDLHFDHYAALVLFYFFNPVVTSLRALQQASGLKKVQRELGVGRASLGSLSEAANVFNPEFLQPLIGELSQRLGPLRTGREAEVLKELTAVDGTLFRALPKMAWALWNYDDKKAARLHLHFEVFKGAPVQAELTHGKYCEKKVMHTMLEAGRLYVMDRGYEQFRLFQDIVNCGSSFICHVREQTTWKVIEERSLTAADRAANVVYDAIVHLGSHKADGVLTQPYRVVMVDTGKTDEKGHKLLLTLVTNRFDLAAELIALAYHYRWQIELFFRWLKCVLGCKHLLSNSQDGVKLQVYLALIASLLVGLWTGHKPTKRTYEMLCFYFLGIADLSEVVAHLKSLDKTTAKKRTSA